MDYKHLESLVALHTLITEDPTTTIVVDPIQNSFTCKLTVEEPDNYKRKTKMISSGYFDTLRNVVANTLVKHIAEIDMKKLVIIAIKAEIKTELTRENNILREARTLLRKRTKE